MDISVERKADLRHLFIIGRCVYRVCNNESERDYFNSLYNNDVIYKQRLRNQNGDEDD